MGSLFAQIIDMNCSQLNIPLEQCKQMRSYDSYLSSYNYPLQKLFKEKRCDKGECMAYFINPSCEGCDSGECMRRCRGRSKEDNGIADILRKIGNKPKDNADSEMQKVINTIVRTVTIRDSPQESINSSSNTKQSEPSSVMTVTHNEVKTITIDQPEPTSTTKKHRGSSKKSSTRRSKKECAEDESSDENSTNFPVKKKRRSKTRSVLYLEEPDMANPTVSAIPKQYGPEMMPFRPQDSSFNAKDNTIRNPIPDKNVSNKDVTVTRIVEQTSIVEKPITLYREMTTTVTKDRPIINYKVTTLTDISTKTERKVVTTTKTLTVSKKETRSKNRSSIDAEESSTRNNSTEDKSIIPSENLEDQCSFLNLKRNKCNHKKSPDASKFNKRSRSKSYHHNNASEEKTVTVTASVPCTTDAPEEAATANIKTVTVDPPQIKEKTVTVTRDSKTESKSIRPKERIVTVTRSNKTEDNRITVTVDSSYASEKIRTVTVEKSIVQSVTVTKTENSAQNVQTVTVERPQIQSSVIPETENSTPIIQTKPAEKSIKPELNIPKNIVITTTFYKQSTSVVTVSAPTVSVITIQAISPNTSTDIMEPDNSISQAANTPCTTTSQLREKSKPKTATKGCEIKNDSKKPRTICRFQHVPKDVLKRLVGADGGNKRSKRKRTVYRTVFSTEGSLSRDDDKVVTTTVYV